MSPFITHSGVLLVEMLALLVGVSFLVELLQRRIGPDRLSRWFGGRPLSAALKGIGLGFVTPFCTFSAIPIWVGMRRAGVSVAGLTAFIVAAPVLDPILFGALALLAGFEVALLYAVVTFTAALGLALMAEFLGAERYLKPIPVALGPSAGSRSASKCDGTCLPSGGPAWTGLRAEAVSAWSAAMALTKGLAVPLLLAVIAAAAITGLVPDGLVTGLAGSTSPFAVPGAALIGTPLYVETAVLVPIGASLLESGAATGAVVALTVAGAAANVPEFAVLSRLARPRLVVALAAFVFVAAVAAGILTPLVVR